MLINISIDIGDHFPLVASNLRLDRWRTIYPHLIYLHSKCLSIDTAPVFYGFSKHLTSHRHMKVSQKRTIAEAAIKILANKSRQNFSFWGITKGRNNHRQIIINHQWFWDISYSGGSRFHNLGIYFYSDPFFAYQAAEFQFCPRLFGISVQSLRSELSVFCLASTNHLSSSTRRW